MAIAYSAMTTLLLERAEALRKRYGNSSMVQEHIVLALLEYCDECKDQDYPIDPELEQALLSVPTMNYSQLQEQLKTRLQQSKILFLDDTRSCEEAIERAEITALLDKEPLLTADLLLRKIRLYSSRSLQRALRQGYSTSTPRPPLGSLLDELGKLGKEPPAESMENMLGPIKQLRQSLSAQVFGQDNAINEVVTGYFKAKSQPLTNKPFATFLFAGAPGVGKTFLAEKTAEALNLPFRRFDMSSFSDKEAALEFSGTDKAYRNGHEGLVTGFVKENPQCVVLFDEIEKAHLNIIHLFLQILDNATLKDSHSGENVSFRQAIVIMTTNAGKELYESLEVDSAPISRKVILNALRNDVNPQTRSPFFPPAICSRFATGNVVMFNPLGSKELVDIAYGKLKDYAVQFGQRHKVEIQVDKALAYALLYAEGGKADARALGGRANMFIAGEVFNWFKFAHELHPNRMNKVRKLDFLLPLENCSEEARNLFGADRTFTALLFGPDKKVFSCLPQQDNITYLYATQAEEARRLLLTEDVDFVLCDILSGAERNLMNVEDTPSAGRGLFETFCKEQIPFYVYCPEGQLFNTEERQALLQQGARGVFAPSEIDDLPRQLQDISSQLYCEKQLQSLARSNKVLTFDCTYQWQDSQQGVVLLNNLRISPAIDAEDKADIAHHGTTNTRFSHIIGGEDAKQELQDFIGYLKNPRSYAANGIPAPRGVLLYGPPGTGKTMLAKAMARESGATFIPAQGNQFLKDTSGASAQEVKRLFALARKYAPSVLFIDEIDIIAKDRMLGGAGLRAEEALNALLNEMDGFSTNSNRPVFVLAATNFDTSFGAKSLLDAALLRRFDRRIFVDLPDKNDRITFIKTRLQKSGKSLDEDTLENLGIRSTGMSLAQLEAVVDFALRCMLRHGKNELTAEALDEAFETYRFGEKTDWDGDVLYQVAVHEAGHALVGYLTGRRPQYITVSGRSSMAGYVQHEGTPDKPVHTKKELLHRICSALAGRAAEEIFLGKENITTGASADLENASNIALKMVTAFGMESRFGLTVVENTPVSEEIRQLCNEILQQEYQNALDLIAQNKDKMEALIQALLVKNHLTGPAMEAIFQA